MVGKTAYMSVLNSPLNQDIHWREGTALVMLAKLLLWVCLLSLNQDIHWTEGTTLVMLAKLLLWVCLLSLNQDIHWREGTTLVMLAKTASMSVLNSLWIKIYIEGEGTALVMLAKQLLRVCLILFESRYTLKGRYSIGNVGKTASMSMLTLFESRYTLNWRYNIGNVGKTCFYEYAYSSLNQDIHWTEGTTLVMLAKLLLWVCLLSLNQDYIEGKVQHW